MVFQCFKGLRKWQSSIRKIRNFRLFLSTRLVFLSLFPKQLNCLRDLMILFFNCVYPGWAFWFPLKISIEPKDARLIWIINWKCYDYFFEPPPPNITKYAQFSMKMNKITFFTFFLFLISIGEKHREHWIDFNYVKLCVPMFELIINH